VSNDIQESLVELRKLVLKGPFPKGSLGEQILYSNTSFLSVPLIGFLHNVADPL
jgi:hypothetical protein